VSPVVKTTSKCITYPVIQQGSDLTDPKRNHMGLQSPYSIPYQEYS
jgi:hypothetical protein